jgi:lipopolysaccharide biosynthesis protein
VTGRVVAFYLPQYHRIPENDGWWGEGFTDWVNVTRAQPRFDWHYQPHQVGELGQYDLTDAGVRQRQANMARSHGVEAFVYWHYWFNGRPLLDQPMREVLASGEPDHRFCLAWANETWSRRWDGRDRDILIAQSYGGREDAEAHFEHILPALRDPRALTVDGRPVFLIYQPLHLVRARERLEIWRQLAERSGLPGLYLLAIATSTTMRGTARLRAIATRIRGGVFTPFDWAALGFDGMVYFQPNVPLLSSAGREIVNVGTALSRRVRAGAQPSPDLVLDYASAARAALSIKLAGEDEYMTVMPGWDSTARRRNGAATIFRGSSPELFGAWLSQELARLEARPWDHRLVFVNAWNEWAEGAHLEPDQKFGTRYLEAVAAALEDEP